MQFLLKIKAVQQQKQIFYAAFTAIIYHIWEVRNQLIFQEKAVQKGQITKAVKEDVIQKALYRAQKNPKYYRYIDGLLG